MMFPLRMESLDVQSNTVNFFKENSAIDETIQARINDLQTKTNMIFEENNLYSVYIGSMDESVNKD